jgi:hypothetical protein
VLYETEEGAEFKHLQSGSALEGRYGSFSLHSTANSNTRPKTFKKFLGAGCALVLSWFTFVKSILRGHSARVAERAVEITFSVLATSFHYINGGAMSTFTSSILSFFPYNNILFLRPFLALLSCFGSALPRKCRNKKNIISWNITPCIPLNVNWQFGKAYRLYHHGWILWHDVRKPKLWSQNKRSLLANDSVNTFPLQQISKQQLSNFHCYTTAL